MAQEIDVNSAVVGQWSTYFDTGLWTFEDGVLFAPKDLTMGQLRDHLLSSGGHVYFHKSGRLAWSRSRK